MSRRRAADGELDESAVPDEPMVPDAGNEPP